jgi:hypothetical protein
VRREGAREGKGPVLPFDYSKEEPRAVRDCSNLIKMFSSFLEITSVLLIAWFVSFLL